MDTNKVVYPQGTKKVVLTAAQYLAVQTIGKAEVFQELGYPNFPGALSAVGTVNGGETVFGPYASGGTFHIFAGAAEVNYAQGIATPRNLSQAASQLQGAPGVLNATGTLTAAMIAAGIVTSTTAAAVVATLDTGAVMDTVLPDMAIGESFDWSAINTGANAFTVTAAASGHTVVGNMAVAAGSSARFRTRKTAAATYITYAIAVPIS